jgi:DNA polymerase V
MYSKNSALDANPPSAQGRIAVGFLAPAADFAVKRHDLNDLLIAHPHATFMWKVSGSSMVAFGIFDKDILVCDRGLEVRHGDMVIAELDGGFSVKQFWKEKGAVQLRAGNKTVAPIHCKDGQTLAICGVVTASIKRFR